MLKCSAKMYRVHKFRHNDRLYIADLDRFWLVEVNEIAWNAMAFTSTLDTDGIVEQLSQTYPRELVLETLKSLEDFQNNDVIFSASWTLLFETNGDRLKIYVPQSRNE